MTVLTNCQYCGVKYETTACDCKNPNCVVNKPPIYSNNTDVNKSFEEWFEKTKYPFDTMQSMLEDAYIAGQQDTICNNQKLVETIQKQEQRIRELEDILNRIIKQYKCPKVNSCHNCDYYTNDECCLITKAEQLLQTKRGEG